MMPAVLFDMDGTLCDVSSIRHYLSGKIRNFDAFHSESVNCPPNEWVADAARQAHNFGLAVLVVTARKVMWARHTAMWLALNGVPSDRIYMRRNNDSRKDYDVKADILARIKLEFDVIHAWDDNPAVIRLWNEHGIPTTVVPGWES